MPTPENGNPISGNKLTDADVAEVRKRYEEGERAFELAQEKGVSYSYMWKVVKGLARVGGRSHTRLSDRDLAIARELREYHNLSVSEVAKKMEVPYSTMADLLSYKKRKHIKPLCEQEGKV